VIANIYSPSRVCDKVTMWEEISNIRRVQNSRAWWFNAQLDTRGKGEELIQLERFRGLMDL